jgi:hypothetical protein
MSSKSYTTILDGRSNGHRATLETFFSAEGNRQKLYCRFYCSLRQPPDVHISIIRKSDGREILPPIEKDPLSFLVCYRIDVEV